MNLDLILLADFVAYQEGRHVFALIALQLNDLRLQLLLSKGRRGQDRHQALL